MHDIIHVETAEVVDIIIRGLTIDPVRTLASLCTS